MDKAIEGKAAMTEDVLASAPKQFQEFVAEPAVAFTPHPGPQME